MTGAAAPALAWSPADTAAPLISPQRGTIDEYQRILPIF